MASLYTQKDKNIRKTWLFMTLFLVFVIGVGWVFAQVFGSSLILYIAIILALFINFLSYWYSDKIVLKISRAQLASERDFQELHRLVENLSITSGLPKPRIYIIDEAQPNAFATGRDPEHAVVAVTRGLVESLNRSELEGVLSHEMSHIGNRDMLLCTVVVVMAGFVAILSDFFLRWTWFGGLRSRSREGNQAQALLMAIALALAILAPIAAMLIRLAISRKREFLADASGALLTRYPQGLISALKKIAAYPRSARVATKATASLYFANPFRGKKAQSWLARLFLTHPPIEERIKALQGLEV